jgi:hypothetical protein
VWSRPTSGLAKLRDSTGITGDRGEHGHKTPAATPIERSYSSAVPEFVCGPNSSGSLAIFAAILRASSLVSHLAAERRPGSS